MKFETLIMIVIIMCTITLGLAVGLEGKNPQVEYQSSEECQHTKDFYNLCSTPSSCETQKCQERHEEFVQKCKLHYVDELYNCVK
jgi:hypothetical protein